MIRNRFLEDVRLKSLFVLFPQRMRLSSTKKRNCWRSEFIFRLSEQLKIDEQLEKDEFGQEENGEPAVVSGILGDSIPVEAMDVSKDPNIVVNEVCPLQAFDESGGP